MESTSESKFKRGDRVVIHLAKEGLFNERHGTVKRVRFAKPVRKTRGWWVTVACDLPPDLKKLECEVAEFALTMEDESPA